MRRRILEIKHYISQYLSSRIFERLDTERIRMELLGVFNEIENIEFPNLETNDFDIYIRQHHPIDRIVINVRFDNMSYQCDILTTFKFGK